MKVIGTDGDWLKVILPEKVGYVYSGYMTAVSYTHLDVYKRQGHLTVPPDVPGRPMQAGRPHLVEVYRVRGCELSGQDIGLFIERIE